MQWLERPLERVLILSLGIAFLAIGLQVTLSHYRQNFHHEAMWAPVVSIPVFCITALVLAFNRSEGLFTFFLVLMCAGVLKGGTGMYYHVHGVGMRVEGFTSRNFPYRTAGRSLLQVRSAFRARLDRLLLEVTL
ncbi:hypothetical protein [Paenibacillus gyeongsangnamensis]|uniref:hypothetical protein n=1 Tax=Paenibacillus gyeongsangnamensis TaxID=3388067 RepID=UPI002FD06D6A